jgi:hypothetical protein
MMFDKDNKTFYLFSCSVRQCEPLAIQKSHKGTLTQFTYFEKSNG